MLILSSLLALVLVAHTLVAIIATARDLRADERRRRLLTPRRTA